MSYSDIIFPMFRQSTLSPFVYLSPALHQDELAASPLAANGMKLLRYAEQNGGIPLTQSMGAFHRKCVEWAAHEFQWPGYEPEILYSVNKVLNEPDFPPLSILHWALQDLRIIRHYKGKALLTKRGRSILVNHGELQAVLAEWMLAAPLQESLSREAAALSWDLRHMLGIVSNRLGDWVTLGDFTEWALPVELFPARGPLGRRHEAGWFIAHNLVRPLTWLGVLEGSPQNVPAMSIIDRQFRKTVLFDKFFRIGLPIGIEAVSLH
ncbi:hypothetical protein [Pararhizobium antarcticum]|nr:hypothetical protein [Pararhizobium antarcticum]